MSFNLASGKTIFSIGFRRHLMGASVKHRFKIKRLHPARIVAGFAALGLQIGNDVLRVFAFRVLAARAVAYLAARVLQLRGFLDRDKPAGLTIAGCVTAITFFYFFGSKIERRCK